MEIPSPTAVLTVVFLAWTAGTAAGGALTRLWGGVGAGHFKVVWLVVATFALATGFGYRPAWIVAGLAVLTYASIYRSLDHVAGAVTAVVAVVTCALGAPAYSLAAAALLGAVTNAMLLGHWHLNQPRLGTDPIKRLVRGLWVGLAAFAIASTLVLLGGAQGVALVGSVTALAFAALTAVLTVMVRQLVKTRSIMSATGILYLEILLCLVAVFTGSLAASAGA